MNKKKVTWFMIIVVSALWGYNIYNTIGLYRNNSETENEKRNEFKAFEFNVHKDTFNLIKPIRDPFLGIAISMFKENYPENQSQKINEQFKKKNESTEKKIEVEWPSIQYLGFVRNHNNKNRRCLLNVNGEILHFEVGKSINELTVLDGNKDSVIVVYNRQEKTIKK